MTLKKRHFTLIELLVVMGLIGLLVTLAVPSFTRLAKGKATPVAADQIKRQLEEAQALAIAHRSYVGLVIVNGNPSDFNFTNDSDDLANNPNPYFHGSTRPAFLFKDSNGDYSFEKWASNSSWSKPIESAKIVDVTKTYNRVPREGTDGTWSTDASNPWTGSDADALQTMDQVSRRCMIVFTPDGGLDSGDDIFLIVSGCTVNGTTLQFADPNFDYVVLHINRFSGKTAFFSKL